MKITYQKAISLQHDYGMVYFAQTAAHSGCASFCREVHSFIGSFIWTVPQHGGETMSRNQTTII